VVFPDIFFPKGDPHDRKNMLVLCVMVIGASTFAP
jgi:hypothetical protein